jgi:hypothetical protein
VTRNNNKKSFPSKELLDMKGRSERGKTRAAQMNLTQSRPGPGLCGSRGQEEGEEKNENRGEQVNPTSESSGQSPHESPGMTQENEHTVRRFVACNSG